MAFTDAPSDEHFFWVLQQFEGLFARRERYVFLIDATKATRIPSAAARHTIGKWQNDHQADSKRWCAGGAILVASALVRGAVTAMSWVHKPAVPQYFPPTRKEAVEWCIKTAEDAGLTLTPQRSFFCAHSTVDEIGDSLTRRRAAPSIFGAFFSGRERRDV
jgi:hypothetical protein